MTASTFRRVVVPVANEDDAAATARALAPYVEETDDPVVAVHVIEKAGGAPDKASVEQREAVAEAAFDVLEDGLADLGIRVRREFRYGTDVAEAVIEAAHDLDASAIVFTPRGGSRWLKLLAGDVTTRLVNESDLPVVVLPDVQGVSGDE